MSLRNLINIDDEILCGVPVFRGTRVPVRSLFDCLRRNYSLEEFLEAFPSVSRESAMHLIERAGIEIVAKATRKSHS